MAKLEAGRRPRLTTLAFIAGLILIMSLIPVRGAAAATDAVRWTDVNIPTEGKAGGWGLAQGSDIQHLTLAADGTLFACVKGLTYTLYRSTDGGVTWSPTGNVQDDIVDIATTPDAIYYATTSAVYRSTDGGDTFDSMLPNPGGAGSDNMEITSIDIGQRDRNIIAAATRDADGGEFGGVYTLDEKDLLPSWTDTDIGSYDVYAIAFSPGYANDRQLIAVITDEIDTVITSRIAEAGWGTTTGNATLERDNSGGSVAVARPAAIAFPGYYNADPVSGKSTLFVAIDTGTGDGDVYKITGTGAPELSAATDLNIAAAYGLSNTDITGLASYGDTATVNLLAGASSGTMTYFSADAGGSWTRTRKEPTGESATCVLMPPGFGDTGRLYAATSGDESAFSASRDMGTTWNQLSLIDTAVTNITDLAPSPGYGQDSTLFMLTLGIEGSLWRSPDGGSTWERLFASALAGVDTINLVALAPRYGEGSQTVFLAGESDGAPAIWSSTDNGQSFRRYFTHDPVTGDPFAVDTWAIIDDTTMFIGSYDGSHGAVYETTNGGFFFSQKAEAGSQMLTDISLSPDYEKDGTILVGNSSGWVYRSSNNGVSFEPLPADAAAAPLAGSVSVAFDAGFASNKTVYAASSTAGKGIFRLVIGTSTGWKSIDSTLPAGARLNHLIVTDDGTLYAANAEADDGMERCLNPSYPLGPTFETVTGGLSDGAILSGLWKFGHRLWSVDTANVRLMTFNDTLTAPVTPTSPANAALGTGILISHAISHVGLDWEPLEGATGYEWQCDCDTDFASIPDGFEGNTTASSASLPSLEADTTYYWRVRASAPVLSPWSERRSFTTSMDTEAISLRLESPHAGASGVPVKPIFQWTAVAGAGAYELLVSLDADFTRPVIVKIDDYALPATAWQCDLSLAYSTTYYWKVRAISASTRSAWSAAGAFTTEPPPSPPTTVTTPSPTATPPPTVTITATATATATAPAITINIPPTTSSPTQITIPQAAATATVTVTPTAPQTTAPAAITTTMPDWVIYTIGGLLLAIILALIIVLTLVIILRRA